MSNYFFKFSGPQSYKPPNATLKIWKTLLSSPITHTLFDYNKVQPFEPI
jgi:hypothetical protein